jgi:hypothetical protein
MLFAAYPSSWETLMRFQKAFAVVFAAILTVAACASGPPKVIHVDEMKDPGLGMIYGQIRLPQPDRLLNLVMIQRVGKVYDGRLGEEVQVTRDGRFVASNLKPGKYMLAGFEIGQTRSMLGKEALNYTVDVKPGGIHYMGIYNYSEAKAGNTLRLGSFDLRPDHRRSSHVELLTWAEEATRKTKWHAEVKRKLAAAIRRASRSSGSRTKASKPPTTSLVTPSSPRK